MKPRDEKFHLKWFRSTIRPKLLTLFEFFIEKDKFYFEMFMFFIMFKLN
jgi:hypothetical protein